LHYESLISLIKNLIVMRKTFLLLAIVFAAILFKVLAEKINIPGLKVPKLIISEVRPDAMQSSYIELTNLGDTTINLSGFTIHSVNSNTRCVAYSDSTITLGPRTNPALDETIGKIYLNGSIKPGESYVIANVYDADNSRRSGIPAHNTAVAMIGKQFAHMADGAGNGFINKPEWQCFGKDSVSRGMHVRLTSDLYAGYLLHWVYLKDTLNNVKDSTYIDQFNFIYSPSENAENGWVSNSKGSANRPIAGVVNAMGTSVMVRKATVTKGNLDWNQSRGVDAPTSEWVCIPRYTSNNMAFTSVGTHGNHSLSYSAKNPANVIINKIDSTISIPWGIVRGDSIARLLNLGKNMGWSYNRNTVFADSASYIYRTGDKVSLYAAGDSLQKIDFKLNVREAQANQAVVFPRRRLQATLRLVPNPITGLNDTTYRYTWSSTFAYGIGEGNGMDSIINVGFATRTDSLMKYLDKPDKAKWEIVYVDGQNRPDVKFGDKLKVTSEDNSTVKEYFIAVTDYAKSNNALLQTVIWPDIDKANYPRWTTGDTIPDFSSLKTINEIELNLEETKVPALQFKTQDPKAKISVVNAVNLTGTIDERTTKVTVTAESDTVSLTYNFTFKKLGIPVQPYIAEPFISELIKATGTQGWAIEIVNPGTVELDLSRYCILRGVAGQTWQQAVETLPAPNSAATWATTTNEIKIYQSHYFPSMRFKNDGSMAEWNAVPDSLNKYAGKGFLVNDGIYDPWVKPGDVWVGGVTRAADNNIPTQRQIFRQADFLWFGYTLDGRDRSNVWPNYKIYLQSTPVWTRNYQYLLKVINDSILDGTKDVRDADAYELIDRFECANESMYPQNATAPLNMTSATNITLVRKPHITKGIQTTIGGPTETPETSEWLYYNNTGNYIGQHAMNPVTNYKSTVTSKVLKVTPGYEGDDLIIKGNIATYTPTTIATILEKADSSQVFVFKRITTVLTADENLADADTLVVTSGNGQNTTKYKLVNIPLDNNTTLMAKSGSGLTVANNKVTGVTVGMKLKDAVDKLEVAPSSTFYVYNTSGGIQSMKMHNRDSLVLDVLVSEDLRIDVIAENSEKASYYFDFGIPNNEAILLSSTLEIDQNRKMILNLPEGTTTVALKTMVFTTKGATIKVLDKAGFERMYGTLYLDDVVEVTAADGFTKATYKISELNVSGLIDVKNKSAFDIQFYPNPVKYVLNFAGTELAKVKVYSLTGMLMISDGNLYGNKLNVSSLVNGIYLIEMTDKEGKIVTDKFLKN
jgi:hypothetical protein